MKKVMRLITVLVALAVTATAAAASGGKFVGSPTCTADSGGNVSCGAKVAGLTDAALAVVSYQTEWVCDADQSITVLADNGPHGPSEPLKNGHTFTVSNGARSPLFYEIIFGIDFGCPGDAWTAARYIDVTIRLMFGSNISYEVGTVYPS